MKSIDDYLKMNYRKSVFQDDDGTYMIEVDDLPGCISEGDTPEEAFANIQIAMRGWIESRITAGLPVPEPRMAGEYSGRILLRMPKFLHQRLAADARHEGVSLNQYLVSVLSAAPGQVYVDAAANMSIFGSSYAPARICSAMYGVSIGWGAQPQGRVAMFYEKAFATRLWPSAGQPLGIDETSQVLVEASSQCLARA